MEWALWCAEVSPLNEPSLALQGQHRSLPQCCDLQGAGFPVRLIREVPSLSVTLTLPYLLLLTCSSIFWSSFLSCDSFVNGTKRIVSDGGSFFWLLVSWPGFDLVWLVTCPWPFFLNQLDLAIFFFTLLALAPTLAGLLTGSLWLLMSDMFGWIDSWIPLSWGPDWILEWLFPDVICLAHDWCF